MDHLTKGQAWMVLAQTADCMMDKEERAEKARQLRELNDTSKKRKARKEYARMLTRQREAELRAQGKWKRK